MRALLSLRSDCMKQALEQYYELRDTLIECYSNDVIFNIIEIL